ncbi:hypothetical protein K435DRAFT_495524 [Dendrothele bispora CBS 962.96]|uniref:Uncharacterized protein n=1 Tax=Dendrothele bispora (strain CBS 962.96) TaxID=1314807 RepID=A0A4S8KX24_DENBC|nr:hypothetical protein K435DRAFT_495524 [Dendrothele bispora CBS 962.96]
MESKRESEKELEPKAQEQAQVEVQAGWGFQLASWGIFRNSANVGLGIPEGVDDHDQHDFNMMEELEEQDVQEQIWEGDSRSHNRDEDLDADLTNRSGFLDMGCESSHSQKLEPEADLSTSSISETKVESLSGEEQRQRRKEAHEEVIPKEPESERWSRSNASSNLGGNTTCDRERQVQGSIEAERGILLPGFVSEDRSQSSKDTESLQAENLKSLELGYHRPYIRAASESSIASSSASVVDLLSAEMHQDIGKEKDVEIQKGANGHLLDGKNKDKGRPDAGMVGGDQVTEQKLGPAALTTPTPPSSYILSVPSEAHTPPPPPSLSLAVGERHLLTPILQQEDSRDSIPGLSHSLSSPAHIPGLSSSPIVLNQFRPLDANPKTLIASTSWASTDCDNTTLVDSQSPKLGEEPIAEQQDQTDMTTIVGDDSGMGMDGFRRNESYDMDIDDTVCDVYHFEDASKSCSVSCLQRHTPISHHPFTIQNLHIQNFSRIVPSKLTSTSVNMYIDALTPPRLLPASWTPPMSNQQISQTPALIRDIPMSSYTSTPSSQSTAPASCPSSQSPEFSSLFRLPDRKSAATPSPLRTSSPGSFQHFSSPTSFTSGSAVLSPKTQAKVPFPVGQKRKQDDVEAEERGTLQEQATSRDRLIDELEERQKEVEAQYTKLQTEIEKRRQQNEALKRKNEKGKEKSIQENNEELPSKTRAWGARSPRGETRHDDWDYYGDRDANDYYNHERHADDLQDQDERQESRKLSRRQNESMIRHLQVELSTVQLALGEGMKKQDEILDRLKELGASNVTLGVMMQVAGTGKKMFGKSPTSSEDAKGEKLSTTEVAPGSEMRTWKESVLLEITDGLFAVMKTKLQLAEKKLEAERQRRVALEQALQDINKECREPFIVPALLEAFIMVSELSGRVKA